MDVGPLLRRQTKTYEYVVQRLAAGNFKRRMFANINDAPPAVTAAGQHALLTAEGLTVGECSVFMALHQRARD